MWCSLWFAVVLMVLMVLVEVVEVVEVEVMEVMGQFAVGVPQRVYSSL